jgi:hypothetical protein
MQMSRVYRVVGDVEHYQAFLLDLPRGSPDALRHLLFDGTSRGSSWTPPPIYVDDPKLKEPDIWTLVGSAVLIVDSAVKMKLDLSVEFACESLPIKYHDRDLELLNITSAINCLDRGASHLESDDDYSDDDDEQYVFIEHRLPEPGLFKVPETATAEVFCVQYSDAPSEGFKSAVEARGFTGLAFQLVWDIESGPVVVPESW